MISIVIEDLVKRFGSHTALDGVSLRIDAGEVFFLLGPSGCGKTTLLRNIAGFLTPDRGRILFGDQDVTKLPAHKRETGMMFQSYALWPHMTVEGNVAFGLEERRVPAGEIKRRVREALESVRMAEYADRKIAQLSGGQQQRVALARALVIRPRALLLDEPLSNLDARLRLEMRGEIRRICKEFGLTAIYVTHDQKEALSISDRMAVLDAGKIAQIGTPAEVYRRPHSRVVADFIGETNILSGTISAISGDEISVDTPIGNFLGKKGDAEWNPQPGQPAAASIRPECWKISESGSGEANTIQGFLTHTIYLGEVAQYEFTSHEQRIKIFELNPRPGAREAGRGLFATAAPEDVVILKP